MQTIINLHDIEFFAYHGVLPIEREKGNTFRVNVTIHGDFSEAAMNDDLSKTVNYAECYAVIEEEMMTPSLLIENAAWRVAKALKSKFSKIESLTVNVRKSTPIDCGATQASSVTVQL